MMESLKSSGQQHGDEHNDQLLKMIFSRDLNFKENDDNSCILLKSYQKINKKLVQRYQEMWEWMVTYKDSQTTGTRNDSDLPEEQVISIQYFLKTLRRIISFEKDLLNELVMSKIRSKRKHYYKRQDLDRPVTVVKKNNRLKHIPNTPTKRTKSKKLVPRRTLIGTVNYKDHFLNILQNHQLRRIYKRYEEGEEEEEEDECDCDCNDSKLHQARTLVSTLVQVNHKTSEILPNNLSKLRHEINLPQLEQEESYQTQNLGYSHLDHNRAIDENENQESLIRKHMDSPEHNDSPYIDIKTDQNTATLTPDIQLAYKGSKDENNLDVSLKDDTYGHDNPSQEGKASIIKIGIQNGDQTPVDNETEDQNYNRKFIDDDENIQNDKGLSSPVDEHSHNNNEEVNQQHPETSPINDNNNHLEITKNHKNRNPEETVMQHNNNKKGKGNTNEVKILIIKHKGHPHFSGYPDRSINIVIGQSKHVPLHHHLQGIIKDNKKKTKQQHHHHPTVDRDEQIHHQYSHHHSRHCLLYTSPSPRDS